MNENQPSLTPSEISKLSDQFRDASAPYYALWYLCTQAVSNWRTSVQADMSLRMADTSDLNHFMRSRDVNFALINPLYCTVVANMLVEEPAAGVLPATSSMDDIAKAEASAQWLHYHWNEANVSDQIGKAVEWAIVRGTAGMLTRHIGNGTVRQEPFGPDRLRAEPGITDPDASRFLGVTRLTTKSALMAQFVNREMRADETPESYAAAVQSAKKAIDQARAPVVFNSTSPQYMGELPKGYVEVLEAYCRSGHWYLLVGNGTVLASGITEGGVMPIQVLRYIRVPDEFWGVGMVELCLAPQYAYSTIINQIIRNARLMSNPKVLIDRASKVDPNAFSSAVGEKVFYNGKAPTVWAPAALPQYMQALPPQLQSTMFDTAGVHGVSTGKRQVGITSGRAVEAMASKDSAQRMQTMRAVSVMVRDMSKVTLVYIKAFTSEDKAARQMDQYGKPALRFLKATDIVDDPEVFIEADTLFVMDARARESRILEEVRLGLLDPADAKKMLKSRLDPTESLRMLADVQHAKQALGTVIMQGYMVPDPLFDAEAIDPMTGMPATAPMVRSVDLYPTDNFKVFTDVIGDFIRSDDFQQLDLKQREDVHQFYLYVLQMAAPALPAPNAKASGGGMPALESVGSPETAGVGGMNGAEAASAQVDIAEATDEFTQ